jgi:hypothetical protein
MTLSEVREREVIYRWVGCLNLAGGGYLYSNESMRGGIEKPRMFVLVYSLNCVNRDLPTFVGPC